MSNKPLFKSADWDLKTIAETWKVIDDVGRNVFGLDYYEPQFEVVTYEQMIDIHTSHGFPSFYSHWSFGKAFIQQHHSYVSGQSGLAYETVINTDPSIAYIMENNTMTMQALVMAHATCGHGSFYKNNYMFREWTNPDSILGYVEYAKNYIIECENKYGPEEVEKLLDAAHSLQYHGMDRMKRGRPMKKEEIQKRKEIWANHIHESVTPTTDMQDLKDRTRSVEAIIEALGEDRRTYPEENLLYFIEKYSPVLKDWQREIVRIVRKISQHFYPNFHTKMMNEGWASFCHYHIMTYLEENDYITSGSYLEFLTSHTGVCCQHEGQAGFSPYALGFAIFRDIERVCKEPTEEDYKWFPEFAGNPDWMAVCKDAVALYRDESFIQKFLSPKVIRDFKMYSVYDDEEEDYLEVTGVSSDEDVYHIREKLADRYQLDSMIPHLEITGVDWDTTRTLHILYNTRNGMLIERGPGLKAEEYIKDLWGYPVEFDRTDDDDEDEE